MRTSIATIFALLSACAPFSAQRTCVTRAGAEVSIGGRYEGTPITCAEAQSAEDAAKSALVTHGLVDAARFNALSKGVQVWIHDDMDFPDAMDCQGGGYAVGCSYEMGGQRWIELTSRGEAWAHETLHSLDATNGVSEKVSGAHAGWDTRGGDGTEIHATSNGFSVYQAGSWVDVTDRAMFQANETP